MTPLLSSSLPIDVVLFLSIFRFLRIDSRKAEREISVVRVVSALPRDEDGKLLLRTFSRRNFIDAN